jgi:hypothetical protein
VILKVPTAYITTFTAGLTSSTSIATSGFTVYSVTAGTGTVTFSLG